MPAAKRVGRRLREVREVDVARRGDAAAGLDVTDEVVLLLKRAVPVGRGARNDEVVVAGRKSELA